MSTMQNSGKIKELCIICEEEKEHGIHLYTSFLCCECEKQMLTLEPGDPFYQYFIEKMRKIKNIQIYS
ncbi:MAG TPA: sigma factor G inhibitor Gin [Bacillus sp. (in: firmicutes)]|uniref:sigma factor G inhibitor Gin n=1 Tax=Bacillus litorisediminis TaxID=2922713 RepID=UPI001FAC44AF|nr:sigma factor G inhibitor Gin [Bacillus litorisediminis]HWO76076.1 sigma factor G inhibitor Gin [Bacillus sp. (in: firmicutes)]